MFPPETEAIIKKPNMKILNKQKDHNLIAQSYRKGMDSHGVKGCLQEETQLEAAIKSRNYLVGA